MTTPEKWLDAAALDLLHDENAHDLLGNYPEVISRARAALALRDELAAAKKQESAQTTAAQRAWLAADTLRNELAECRAKLAQAQTDIDGWRHGFKCDFCAESEKKLAQAEQTMAAAAEANVTASAIYAASQARERELRDAGEALRVAVSEGGKYEEWVAACEQFISALARPADDSALREMLAKAADAGRLAGDCACLGEKAEVTEAIVDRLLGGGK